MAKLKHLMLIPFIFTLIYSFAHAEESSNKKDWEFNLAPLYLWAVSMDGDVTLKGQTQSVQADFDELFDQLELMFTVHFEAWYKQKWGLLVDVSYVDIGAGGQQTIQLQGPGPIGITRNVDASLDVNFKDTLVELGGFYRFYQRDRHTFDGIGGIRYTDVEIDGSFAVVGPKRGNSIPLEGNKDWVDAIVGVRYKWTISEKWSLDLRGDIGGFGIGSSSDFTWNAIGFIYFQPWKHVGFVGGYRALDVDYERGEGIDKFKYDMLMHGPLFAVNFTW